MDAIEKRARELVMAEIPDLAKECFGYQGMTVVNLHVVMRILRAALTPSEGHVVVTRNEAGQAVAVTRQDDEGRNLSLIAEFGPPEGYVPERSVLVAATRLRKLASAAHPMARSAYIKAAEMVEMAVIAGRPEVKP